METLVLAGPPTEPHAFFPLFPPFNANNWAASVGRAHTLTGSEQHREQRGIFIGIRGSAAQNGWGETNCLDRKTNGGSRQSPCPAPRRLFPGACAQIPAPKRQRAHLKGNLFCCTESTRLLPWLEAQGRQARCWAWSWWHYLLGPREMIWKTSW